MNIFRKILLVIAIILFGSSLNASINDLPITSEGEIKFYLDFAGFKGENNKTYQEFYLMIFEDELNSIVNSSENNEINIETSIRDNFGKSISSKSWVTEIYFNRDSTKLNYFTIYDQWRELLEPGNYNLTVKLSDARNKLTGLIQNKISIKDFHSNKLIASDIEFVSDYKKSTQQDQFSKGSSRVKPNPWRRYGILLPTLTFYYELYNLPMQDSSKLSVQYEIIDFNGKTIKTFPLTKLKYSGSDKAVLHGLNTSNLGSGIYTLSVNIKNASEIKLYNFARQFEVIQSDYISLSANSNKQIEMSINVLPYIASPVEINYFEKLNESAKIEYIVRFWKDHDSNPNDNYNQFFESIYNRYNYANENFSWSKIEGWQTDMGRVYIQNGNPDEISRFYFEDSYKPYEVWNYYTDRSFSFVFCDTQLNDRFILLHSTKIGEIFNSDWRYQAAR